MPEFQTFLSGQALEEFWYWIKWLLFYVGPVVMILVALFAAEEIVKVIRSIFLKKDDDDDDYDVYRY
ncbi:hypothetical protein BKP35_18260 [Anaerobacillus arseniciselenatis]|uniref:Uncharacterized protein n=1 Tax=Anaerobacillus arseniciselenatis TaxID=85682 RepID=A0A1S2L5H8_9BACI|nr:hypothetical protein [Anaerobacillus arseniciselenatis]OIJ07631.1 hypothetical protein BKP35_18260 [Anaerobacillus arseniciselenatis]